jgi:5-methylcytosine-specific restriction endonuclease McrA
VIASATRRYVRRRARGRCEDCRLPQSAAPYFTFHVEHIRARQHGGSDEAINLCLACPDCNAMKGPNLTGIDPATDSLVELFNPRADRWSEHFAWVGARIVGRTPQGRATARLLRLNDDERLRMREELLARGER